MDTTVFVLILTPLILFLAFLVWNQMEWKKERQEIEKSRQIERNSWEEERKDLLNRLMTKEWTSYAQLSMSGNTHSDFDDVVEGMSDEEEMSRWGHNLAQAEETGETIIELPTEESLQSELRDLGLVEDE